MLLMSQRARFPVSKQSHCPGEAWLLLSGATTTCVKLTIGYTSQRYYQIHLLTGKSVCKYFCGIQISVH